MKSIILFGHGARDPDWALPIQRLAELVQRLEPGARVQTAFLEFMQPGLPAAIDAAINNGAVEVVIVPVFLAQGGHVKRDLPEMIEQARCRSPELQIRLLPALGECEAVLQAMATVIVHD